VAKKKGQSVGQTIGGILVGFDAQVFRTTPPVNELVAKGTPLRAVAAGGGGTISVGMPEDEAAATDPDAPDPDASGADAPDRLRLAAPDVEIVVDLVHGGRLASAVIEGREILVTGDPDPLRWGAYPMAPYAGRIRHGRFDFRGRTYTLPLGLPPHAIHGTVMHRQWRRVDDTTIETELGPDWPFAGRVVQRFELAAGRLDVRLELHAEEPMPASMGWHPWFQRRPPPAVGRGPASAAPSRGGSSVSPVELDFDAAAMYVKADDGVATREVVTPPAGPWDECFTDLRHPPVLRWPGFLELKIESDARDWVVYTEPENAICVEPQTAPPGALDRDAALVEPGAPFVTSMTWTWRSLGE
jgi:aldose 1-epimerase